MALKTKRGRAGGSAESPQLDIVVYDDADAAIDYATALNAAIDAAPISLMGIPIGSVQNVEEFSDSKYRFTVGYSALPTPSTLSRPEPPEINTVLRTANYNAKSKKLFNFLEPIGVYGPTGDVTADYSQTKWKIDSQAADAFSYAISPGTMFDPLPETDTLAFFAPNDFVDDAYFNSIRSIMGHFNNALWRDCTQGSSQLVRFSANPRSAEDWELSFGFGYQEEQSTIDIGGDITIPTLRGSWYYWVRDSLELNNTATPPILERFPDLAFVGRVWPESDFNILDIPA